MCVSVCDCGVNQTEQDIERRHPGLWEHFYCLLAFYSSVDHPSNQWL